MTLARVYYSSAVAYFGNRLRSTAWYKVDKATQQKALMQASYLISGAFVFSSNAYEIDANGNVVWDERIQAAICEEAIWLLEHNPADIPETLFKGLASASAGAVSATFSKDFVIPWIAPNVAMIIGDLGTLIDSDGDSYVKATLMAL